MRHIHTDLEARSFAEIKDVSTHRYANHPTTEVTCMAWGYTPDCVELWLPGDPVPDDFYGDDVIMVAHNASFERAMWKPQMVKKHGFPPVPTKRWDCTAIRAGHAGLPHGLDKLSRVLDLKDLAKDKEGQANMLRLCKPLKSGKPVEGIYQKGVFDNDPERHKLNGRYCQQDVRAEFGVIDKTPPLSAKELAGFHLDQEINDRGVPIDLDLCRGAVCIVDREATVSGERLSELTAGWIYHSPKGKDHVGIDAPTQRERIVGYCLERGVELPIGEKGTPTLAEEYLEPFLDDTDEYNLPDDCREMLEIYARNNSSAIRKYTAALAQCCPDGFARDQFGFYRAGTGRWGARGIQLQNLKRPLFKITQEIIEIITAGDYDALREITDNVSRERNKRISPVDYLASGVRAMIQAKPGHSLIVSDFSAVEGRGLGWEAGSNYLLDLYASGKCLYSDMGGKIFGVDPEWISRLHEEAEHLDADQKTEDHRTAKRYRQCGKVAILGLGYGCGWQKFQKMAGGQAYNVKLTDLEAKNIVTVYRDAYPEVPKLWKAVGDAAISAVNNPGSRIMAGKCLFYMEDDFLVIELPSTRKLYYFQPELEVDGSRVSLSYMNNKGLRERTYGAKLVENIVQADCRELLLDAMFRIDRWSKDIIMHCHDEVVLHSPEKRASFLVKRLQQEMTYVPGWAKGFPIGAATHSCKRYEK